MSDTSFFQELQALRERPIPDLTEANRKKDGYRRIAIDRKGPGFDEPLVPLSRLGIAGLNYYHRSDNPPYYGQVPGAIAALLLRKSVAERLNSVDERLRRRGLQLHVHDAWRPTAVQRYFYETWMPAWLRERYPGLDRDALTRTVEEYWAAPTTSAESPAPHNTGGAVDLTIRFVQTGEHLWMGSLFDDVTEIAHSDYFELRAARDQSYSDEEARQNRRLLYWLMSEAGFANNPSEWWHFSWGDQMWAALTGAKAALFGPAQPE